MAEAIGAIEKDATTDRVVRLRIANGETRRLLDGTAAVLPEEMPGVRIAHLHRRAQLGRKANQVAKAPPADFLNVPPRDFASLEKMRLWTKSNQPPSKWTSCRKSELSQR